MSKKPYTKAEAEYCRRKLAFYEALDLFQRNADVRKDPTLGDEGLVAAEAIGNAFGARDYFRAPFIEADEERARIAAEKAAKKKPARPKRKSRSQQWQEAVDDMRSALGSLEDAKSQWESAVDGIKSIREEFENWRDNLDGKFEGSALVEKLEAICEFDLDSTEVDLSELESLCDELEGADLPLGFGRD